MDTFRRLNAAVSTVAFEDKDHANEGESTFHDLEVLVRTAKNRRVEYQHQLIFSLLSVPDSNKVKGDQYVRGILGKLYRFDSETETNIGIDNDNDEGGGGWLFSLILALQDSGSLAFSISSWKQALSLATPEANEAELLLSILGLLIKQNINAKMALPPLPSHRSFDRSPEGDKRSPNNSSASASLHVDGPLIKLEDLVERIEKQDAKIEELSLQVIHLTQKLTNSTQTSSKDSNEDNLGSHHIFLGDLI